MSSERRAMLSLWTPGVAGIIGGAVGSVLTGLVRALGIPSEARAHDAAIRDRDGQLATWVADRVYSLRQVCTARRQRAERAGTKEREALAVARELLALVREWRKKD